MTPEVIAQAGAIVDSFLAAVKELQQGMGQAVTLLEGFKTQIDQVKAAQAQIPAGKGHKTYGRDAN
jgi:hypothetical protein